MTKFQSPSGIDVLQYIDYRAYLSDYLAWKRANSPRFSVRAFCQRAGVSTDNYLLRIIRRQKNLGPKLAVQFARAIPLKGVEAQYFRKLVELESAKELKARERTLLELERLRRLRSGLHVITDNSVIRHWYTGAIWELASCKDFNLTPRSAAATLIPKITVQEAKEAIELLVSREYLVECQGRWVQKETSLSSSDGVTDWIVRLNHRQTVEAALLAIDRPLDERAFFGLTLAFNPARMSEVKKRLRSCMDDLRSEFSQDPSANQVFRFNAHCFPLTNPIRSPNKTES